jgi:hypothetical protein
MPSDPVAGAAPSGATTLTQRRCARCRQLFDGDPTLPTTPIAEWWACPPCRESLLGARDSQAQALT